MNACSMNNAPQMKRLISLREPMFQVVLGMSSFSLAALIWVALS